MPDLRSTTVATTIAVAIALALAMILSACAPSPATDSTQATIPSAVAFTADELPPIPQLDTDRVEQGQIIYGQYCSSCHGADLTGEPNWKVRNDDGSLRPPPHDNSGHTWHHSDQLLLSITRDSSDLAESRMPPFGDSLSDDEIMSILEFLKSVWGPEEREFQWRVTWSEQQRTDS